MKTTNAVRCLPWPHSGAGFRVFCLPHAGGSANAFFPWMSGCAESGLAVDPVEYPGRGTRADEPLPTSVDQLSDALIAELYDMMQAGPFALLGHSLGALVAFCITQRLEMLGMRSPSRIVLCGAEPPGARRRNPWHALERPILIERLRSLGASKAWDNEDVVDFVLPTIRADLAAAENWTLRDTTPLATPVVAVAGTRDVMAPPDSVAEWRLFAGGSFCFHLVEGDHFFLHRHPQLVLSFARLGSVLD